MRFQEWHCTIRGPADTEFEGGLYHFRITLPPEYPFRPPSIIMLTPNGRFELNTKVRLLARRDRMAKDTPLTLCLRYALALPTVSVLPDRPTPLLNILHPRS